MTKVNTCDLCNSKNIKPLYKIETTKPDFSVSICSDCGLIFQNPRFSDEEISSFYKKDYYEGDSDYSYIDERENFKGSSYVWNKRLNKLAKSINKKPENLRILDIGCSFGGFLKCAKNNGMKVYGIDISEYSTKYAKDVLKLKNIICGQLSNDLYEENFFDIITMVEVIEHLQNPKEILTEIFRILKPGGVALIQTANMDGKQAKVAGKNYHYFLPGHLFYFSKNTLSKYLKEIGFKKIKVFHGVDFGLFPKLKKSAGTFNKWHHYLKWFRISFYHFISAIHFRDFAMTSSMVVYAFK